MSNLIGGILIHREYSKSIAIPSEKGLIVWC